MFRSSVLLIHGSVTPYALIGLDPDKKRVYARSGGPFGAPSKAPYTGICPDTKAARGTTRREYAPTKAIQYGQGIALAMQRIENIEVRMEAMPCRLPKSTLSKAVTTRPE
jgi:hypothetical protein